MIVRSFDLRLWFAVVALGTIAAISAVSAYWVSDFLKRSLLEREAEVSQEFMESIIRVDGAAMFGGGRSADDAAQQAALAYYANHIRSMPGVLRVNIYSKSRRMLWSSESQLIGQSFDDNDELVAAAAGRRITEISSSETEAKSEHVALNQSLHFIEAYIPIRADGGRGDVLGVVEVYKGSQSLDATIRHAQAVVWIGAAASGLILFLVLSSLVWRAADLIEKQQKDIAQMEAFAAIGQMAGAVAHSLRNPMAGIRSSAELWRMSRADEDRAVADDIVSEIDRMDGYVRDLLAYTQTEAASTHAIDIDGVLRRLIEKLGPAIDRHGIAVRTERGSAVSGRVLADERLLEQALTSVVVNAIEAMPQGGRLDLRVSASSDPSATQLDVVDTGSGIPAEIIDRVARSYFTTKSRGLGLGLVLARGIIQHFGGSLAIASVPGTGTTVSIRLRTA